MTFTFICIAEEENQQGWCLAEDDGNQIKKQKHPLLVRQIPVVMSKLQEFKVGSAALLKFNFVYCVIAKGYKSDVVNHGKN